MYIGYNNEGIIECVSEVSISPLYNGNIAEVMNANIGDAYANNALLPKPKNHKHHIFDGVQWVEDIAAKASADNADEINKLEKVDKATLRLLISLIDKLLTTSVIQESAFTTEEVNLYNRVKSLKGQIW